MLNLDESTYRKSREILKSIAAGLSDEERYAVTAGTCARIYGFDPPSER
jgi:hypothetical protein